MKIKPLYESKLQRAKRLPVDTWFVWPDVVPKRYEYYQPRVYQVLENHQTSRPVYEDFGVWSHTEGVNSPKEAYARASANTAHFNAIHADYAAALTYVVEQQRQRMVGATSRLAKFLLG